MKQLLLKVLFHLFIQGPCEILLSLSISQIRKMRCRKVINPKKALLINEGDRTQTQQSLSMPLSIVTYLTPVFKKLKSILG